MTILQDLSMDELQLIASRVRLCDLPPLSRTSSRLRIACARTAIDLANQDRTVHGGLNQRQQHAYVAAVLFGRSVFITGGAGVGKSHVSNRIVRGLALMELSRQNTATIGIALNLSEHQLRSGRVPHITAHLLMCDMPTAERESFERTLLCMQQGPKTSVAVTASTGTAAQLIHGLTLHSCLGIAVRDEGDSPEDDEKSACVAENEDDEVVRNHKRKRDGADARRLHCIGCTRFSKKIIPRIRKLVIDEISMISADLLDAVCLGLREDKSHVDDLPFGGVQIIAVGDWLQLPPVLPENDTIYNPTGAHPTEKRVFAFESNAWRWLQPTVIELTEVMRQDERERKFVQVLNDMRRGQLSINDARWISKNGVADETEDEQPGITLFHRTNDVRNENQRRLQELHTDDMVFLAADTISLNLLTEQYSAALRKVTIFSKVLLEETIGSGDEVQMTREEAYTWLETQRTTFPHRNPQVPAYAIKPPRALADVVYLKMGCRVRCTRNILSEVDDTVVLEVANGRTGTVVAYVRSGGATLLHLPTLRMAAVAEGWAVSQTGGSSPETPDSPATAASIDGVSDEALRNHFVANFKHPALYVLWDPLDADQSPYFCSMQRATNRRHVLIPDASLPAHQKKRVTVERCQYPLEICYAKSIHQSQGSTINCRVNMDLVQVTYRKRTWIDAECFNDEFVAPEGLIYTALSRVKSLSLVKFLQTLPSHMTRRDGRLNGCVVAPKHARAHQKALDYYERFTTPPLPAWVSQL